MINISPQKQQRLLLSIYITIPTLNFISIQNMLNIDWHERFIYFILISTIISMFASYIKNLYKPLHSQNLFESSIITVVIWTINFLIVISIAFLINDAQNFSRTLIVSWIITNILLFICIRFFLKKIITKKNQNIIIIGDDYEFTQHEIQRLTKLKITLIHFTCPSDDEVLSNIIQEKNIKSIVLNITTDNHSLTKSLVTKELEGVNILTLASFMETYLRKYYIPLHDQELLYLTDIKHFNKKQILEKTIIDLLGAILLLLISIPAFIYSTYKIKNQSPGNVLFRQKRTGKNNIDFHAYKFRSMHENSHFNPYTQKQDTRIFAYGNFMRKTRIDELPQAFNILRRQMHLIGPRAEWDILSKKYFDEVPYYNLRNLIKPGITGWAQVNYPYGANVNDARQKLMYDLYYIKNWSLALEIETAWKTISVILRKQGI